VIHTGANTVAFEMWGIGGSASIQYAAPHIEGIQFFNMPAAFRIMRIPATEARYLRWVDCWVRYMSGAAMVSGAFIEAGLLENVTIRNIQFDSGQNTGPNQLIRCATGSLIDCVVDQLHWPCGNNGAQWAEAAGSLTRCRVTNSRMRVSRPNDRNVIFSNTYYGSGNYLTHQSTIETFAGDGAKTYWDVGHSFADADVSVIVTPLNSNAGDAGIRYVQRLSGKVRIHFSSAPKAGDVMVGVDVRLSV